MGDLPHVLLGVSEMQLHPQEIQVPDYLSKQFPKMRFFKSRLTGKILCQGSLGLHDLAREGVTLRDNKRKVVSLI